MQTIGCQTWILLPCSAPLTSNIRTPWFRAIRLRCSFADLCLCRGNNIICIIFTQRKILVIVFGTSFLCTHRHGAHGHQHCKKCRRHLFLPFAFLVFHALWGKYKKTIDVLFGRYIPASPKLKKKPKNLDFWKQTWYNTKRQIRKACLQPQTGGFRQASLVTFSGCSAVGSARGLGPRCRRFESCHSDHSSFSIAYSEA